MGWGGRRGRLRAVRGVVGRPERRRGTLDGNVGRKRRRSGRGHGAPASARCTRSHDPPESDTNVREARDNAAARPGGRARSRWGPGRTATEGTARSARPALFLPPSRLHGREPASLVQAPVQCRRPRHSRAVLVPSPPLDHPAHRRKQFRRRDPVAAGQPARRVDPRRRRDRRALPHRRRRRAGASRLRRPPPRLSLAAGGGLDRRTRLGLGDGRGREGGALGRRALAPLLDHLGSVGREWRVGGGGGGGGCGWASAGWAVEERRWAETPLWRTSPFFYQKKRLNPTLFCASPSARGSESSGEARRGGAAGAQPRRRLQLHPREASTGYRHFS